MEDKILDIKEIGENFDYRTTPISICPLYVDVEDRETKLFKKTLYENFHDLIQTSPFKVLNYRTKYNENLKLNSAQIRKLYMFLIKEMSYKYSYLDLFNIASEYFDIETDRFLHHMHKKDKVLLVTFIKKRRQLSI